MCTLHIFELFGFYLVFFRKKNQIKFKNNFKLINPWCSVLLLPICDVKILEKNKNTKPPGRIELPTPGLQDQCSNHWAMEAYILANILILKCIFFIPIWDYFFFRTKNEFLVEKFISTKMCWLQIRSCSHLEFFREFNNFDSLLNE